MISQSIMFLRNLSPCLLIMSSPRRRGSSLSEDFLDPRLRGDDGVVVRDDVIVIRDVGLVIFVEDIIFQLQIQFQLCLAVPSQ